MRFKKAELVCTGSELLSAKVNSYVPLFSAKLAALGFKLSGERTVGDSRGGAAGAMRSALREADLVLVCGGLGPTFDDVTRQAAAQVLDRKLRYSKYAAQILRADYGLKKLPPNFRNQCLILDGAKMVENANGTAFGQILTAGRKMLVLLPGPLREWPPMFDSFVSDAVREFFGTGEGTVGSRRLKIAGLWEVQTANLLRPVMRRFRNADYTVLAGPYTAEFAFTVKGRGPKETAAALSAVEKACRRKLKDHIYGTGDETLEEAVGEILKAKGATVSVAESCTGGALASALTDVPGSSEYFLGGVTAYANEAKRRLLGVRAGTILKHGAVSGECAAEMAEAARRLFRTDYAAAVTGIAGPGGGTAEKPVGLVHFAVAAAGRKTVRFSRNFRHNRVFIKRCAVNAALDALRKIIQ
ncbi:MAG: hypothetical protein A3J79_05310 [Elusimicrobia bacterium RIFOXYB2_FULL_62_6]|nr:MAG: hypothetical protein A3J79_05310 [Elusimicrobia bacterium RIFOXYB2_FULL_62_6]